MKSWKTLLSDKRWLFLLGIVAFAIITSLFERVMRRGQPPHVAQQNRSQDSGERREGRRDQREPPRQLSEEFEGTTGPTEQLKPDPALTAPATLRQIRTNAHDDFDRVVFDFQGDTPPGFRAEYIDKLTRKCGSDELKMQGSTWLLVRMTPAQARTETGRTSLGSIEFDEDLKAVRDIRQACDADRQIEWLIEVADRKPYRAEPLPGPARLVIDIKH